MRRWVSISPRAVERLLDYGRLHAESGVERIGVLVGCGDLIADAVEMTLESSQHHAVLDDGRLLQLLQTLDGRSYVIGWWHTHRDDPYPSHLDVRTQEGWQALYEDSIAATVSAERMIVLLWRVEDGRPLIVREVKLRDVER